MDNKQLLKEFESEFAKIKKEFGFKVSLEELDEIFFIKDSVLQDGFISNKLIGQIGFKIVHIYMNWNNYLHGLIFPNQGNMIVMNESRMFNDREKKGINKLVSKSMGLISTNTLVGLTKDKVKEAKFIDDSVKFWNETFKLEIEKIIRKVNKGWLSGK